MQKHTQKPKDTQRKSRKKMFDKILFISLLFLSSCQKNWTCELEVNHNNQGWEHVSSYEFTGTKEEMKAQEEKSSFTYDQTQYKTTCK